MMPTSIFIWRLGMGQRSPDLVAGMGWSLICAAAPALACDGMVCLPTTCLGTHRHVSTAPDTRLPFASRNVTLLSHLTLDQIGGVNGTTGSSVYGWTDPLTRREYAIMGRSNGTAFVDIT
jgi:hypothetical protein